MSRPCKCGDDNRSVTDILLYVLCVIKEDTNRCQNKLQNTNWHPLCTQMFFCVREAILPQYDRRLGLCLGFSFRGLVRSTVRVG